MSGRWSRVSVALLVGASLAFLLMPVGLVVLFGFHSAGRLNFPFDGFSLRWYHAVRDSPEYGSALRNSLLVASGSAVVTMTLGTLAAFGLRAAPPRARLLLGLLFFAPIALPPLFLGLSLLTVFSRLNVPLSLWTVGIGHVVLAFPYFLLIALSVVERLDPGLDVLAADLGATRFQTFRSVTLPLVWPILLAATILVFAISFDEFVITFFVIGPDSTVPLVLWSTMRRSVDPTINVLATVLVLVTIVGALVPALLAFGRRGRRVFREAR